MLFVKVCGAKIMLGKKGDFGKRQMKFCGIDRLLSLL